jgi:dihydroorotase-like cyclic amidohydrolase
MTTVTAVAAVTGGTVVAPDGVCPADVLIGDRKIAGIAEAGSASGPAVDAAGCYVLPGGVDPHCHLMSGVAAATAAAARGGTTTALSFTNPEPGQGDLESLHRRREELGRGDAAIDVGLHAMLYDPGRATLEDLVAARRAGAAAVKVFLAYPELGIMFSTRRLQRLMSDARRAGLLVQVHCENGPLIEELVDGAVRAGRRGEHVFADTRPPEVEEEAVARTLAVASLTGATCYLVHLSTAGALDQVRLARRRDRPPASAPGCRCCCPRGCAVGYPSRAWCSWRRRTRPVRSGTTRVRGRWRPALTLTSWCSTRPARPCSAMTRSTTAPAAASTRACERGAACARYCCGAR